MEMGGKERRMIRVKRLKEEGIEGGKGRGKKQE